jgi:hypothetical protein
MYMFQDGSTLPMAQRAYHPEEFLRSETLKLGILFSETKTETSQIRGCLYVTCLPGWLACQAIIPFASL